MLSAAQRRRNAPTVVVAVLVAGLLAGPAQLAHAAWLADAGGTARSAARAVAPASGISLAQSCAPAAANTVTYVGSNAYDATSSISAAAPTGTSAGDLLLVHL